MKKFLSIFSICVATVFTMFATGCGKGVEADEPHIPFDFSDSTNPVVTINTPTDNQVFKNGGVIHVTGKVTDNSLYQGTIRITDNTSNIIVINQVYEIHGFTSYNFSVDAAVDVRIPSQYTVSVQFEDHGLNPGGKTVNLTINP